MNILYFLLLIGLFFLLGKSADLLIDGIKILGLKLKIKTIYLGFILGLITTLPEIFIGINAVSEGIPALAYGNLIGGVVVLLGFMMGLNIIFRRGIKITSEFSTSILILLVVFFMLPIVFIWNGRISQLEGLILIILYMVLAVAFFNSREKTISAEPRRTGVTLKHSLIITFIGLIGVIILSKFIITTTLLLLDGLKIPKLMLGIIVFSLGTNLPELIIVFESWKKKFQGIALGNLVGSAMANILVIGIFSLIKAVEIPITQDFYFFAIIFFVIVVLFSIFAKTGKRLRPAEGMVLIGLYVLFLIVEFLF